jgi:uncharacterized membrane protein YccC
MSSTRPSSPPPDHRPAEPPRRLDLLVRSTPGRPAIVAGLRTAVATMVPLLVSEVLQLGAFGTWASLGGFSAAVADRGGVYRTRAFTMGGLTVGAALGVSLGGMIGNNGWVAVPLTFAIVWALSLLRAFGVSAGGVGSSIAVAYAISLAAPAHGPMDSMWRGIDLLAGGAWAMFLALVLWPVRPFRPLRLATARCYLDLAAYAERVARDAEIAPDEDDRLAVESERRVIREGIEQARSVVAAARRGGQGDARRGQRLLVLVQGADVVFGTLIALGELFETARLQDRAKEALAGAGVTLRRFAASARRIADVVATEPAATSALAELSTSTAMAVPNERETLVGAHLGRLLAQLEEYAAVLAANADALESGRTPPIPSAIAVLTIVDDEPPVMETLRASFTMSSLAMRHALRVAIVTAVAVMVTRAFALPHGYWVTITAIIILQPYAGATTIKAVQRVVGTVAGALLTVALVAIVQDPRGLLVVIFVLAAACVAFLRVNYLIYSVFLTPTFVLLAEMSAGDWHLAQLRALNTVIGGVLGLAGAWLLWPAPERARFPELAAAAIRAAAAHLRVVAAMWSSTDDESSAALAAARREAALATTNAEASFERLVAESARSRRALEPGTTLLTFTRRLVAADIALGTLRHVPDAAAIRDEVDVFARRLTENLAGIADAVAARRVPPPLHLPDVIGGSHADLTEPQFHRVLRQAQIIHHAATRLAAA